MKIGWLGDEYDWAGGAELTMAALKVAAPEGVEIVDCPPGDVKGGMDRYVAGNVVSYSITDLLALGGEPDRLVKYVNDVWPHGDPALRRWVCDGATLVFCSPLHRDRFPWPVTGETHLVPPPIDLDRFHAAAEGSPGRAGACWAGMAFYGKGIGQALEWAAQNAPEGLDFYGHGPMMPQPSQLARPKGAVPYPDMPAVLARYERFVFLPTQLEPFARVVVEARAAGCELVVNRNVGALHWLEHDPAALSTAAEDFWKVVVR